MVHINVIFVRFIVEMEATSFLKLSLIIGLDYWFNAHALEFIWNWILFADVETIRWSV